MYYIIYLYICDDCGFKNHFPSSCKQCMELDCGHSFIHFRLYLYIYPGT